MRGIFAEGVDMAAHELGWFSSRVFLKGAGLPGGAVRIMSTLDALRLGLVSP